MHHDPLYHRDLHLHLCDRQIDLCLGEAYPLNPSAHLFEVRLGRLYRGPTLDPLFCHDLRICLLALLLCSRGWRSRNRPRLRGAMSGDVVISTFYALRGRHGRHGRHGLLDLLDLPCHHDLDLCSGLCLLGLVDPRLDHP
jgi:hypothetical protein